MYKAFVVSSFFVLLKLTTYITVTSPRMISPPDSNHNPATKREVETPSGFELNSRPLARRANLKAQ